MDAGDKTKKINILQELEFARRKGTPDVKGGEINQKSRSDLQKILSLAKRIQYNFQTIEKKSSFSKLQELFSQINSLNKLNDKIKKEGFGQKNAYIKLNLKEFKFSKNISVKPNKLLTDSPISSEKKKHIDESSGKLLKKQKYDKESNIKNYLINLDNPNPKCLISALSDALKLKPKEQMEKALLEEEFILNAAFHKDASIYVDICINTNMLLHAHAFLTNCYLKSNSKENQTKSRKKRKFREVNDANIYHKLIRAFLSEKSVNFDAVEKLFLQLIDKASSSSSKPSPIFFSSLMFFQNPQDFLTKETLGLAFLALSVCSILNSQIYKKNNPFEKSFLQTHSENLRNICQRLQALGLDKKNIFESDSFNEIEKHLILLAIKSTDVTFKLPSLSSKTHFISGSSLPKTSRNDELRKKWTKQINMELHDFFSIDSIIHTPGPITFQVHQGRENLKFMEKEWKSKLLEGFLFNKKILQRQDDQIFGNFSLVPFLSIWEPSVYVDLMIQELETIGRDMSIFSLSISTLHFNFGSKIQNKFIKEVKSHPKCMKKLFEIYKNYITRINEKKIESHRELWMNIEKEVDLDQLNTLQSCHKTPSSSRQPFMLDYHLFHSSFQCEDWSFSTKKQLGKFFYDILRSEIKIKNDFSSGGSKASQIPALYMVFKMRNGEPLQEIMPHPQLTKLYEEAQLSRLSFDPIFLPMLLPPVPWTSYNKGGLLMNNIELVRHSFKCEEQIKLIRSFPTSSSPLTPIYDSLNALSFCSWKINKKMLDIINFIFVSGGNEKLDIPEKVVKKTEETKVKEELTIEEKMKKIKEQKELVKKNKEKYSLWCTELYRLSIANKFKDDLIWFPHNLDFRGRTYPTSPHLNHIGNDLSRSLLKFGEGKELGKEGLNWLMIHLVNLTGLLKRVSNEERLNFAKEHLPLILDSAENPLEGKLWWQKSEKPLQTLACCFEIAEALKSPKPELFVSDLPCHQDGSCNGLQHYAALGRDQEGAVSVSLVPLDKPQDVYSDVVQLIEEDRKRDAENGVEIAKYLEGFVKRKVVKQSIMTTVYGVTKYGARLQIGRQLEDIPNFPVEKLFEAKFYLTNLTFQSLKKLFHASEQIQSWFLICAEIISSVRGEKVSWLTPLHWPVLQPYSKRIVLKIKSHMNPTDPRLVYLKPNTIKQKNAFAPNFIHSLDSSHMFLTANSCFKSGITFASVHDCFWTHASSIHQMNKICREQFIYLHKKPILEDLSLHFVKTFGYSDQEIENETNKLKKIAKEKINEVFKNIPKKGSLDIDLVLKSTYFFS